MPLSRKYLREPVLRLSDAQAKAGAIRNFTGFDAPYEAPETPEIHLRTLDEKPDQMADRIIRDLIARDIITPA